MGLLIQIGIRKIIYGPIISIHSQSLCRSNPEEDIKKFHLIDNNLQIIKWVPNNKNMILKNLKEIIELC